MMAGAAARKRVSVTAEMHKRGPRIDAGHGAGWRCGSAPLPMWEFGLMSAVLALVTAAMQRRGIRVVAGHDLGTEVTRACNASGGDQLGRAHSDDRQPGLSGAQADAQATTTKLGMRSVQLSFPCRYDGRIMPLPMVCWSNIW
jgi:hypothetical protein